MTRLVIMANYYIYLISSLPMLHFGARPPFSFEKFIKMCEALVPETDLKVLEPLTLDPLPVGERVGVRGVASQPTLQKWQVFDTALRNELVKIRAGRKHIDPAKYLRRDDEYFDASISRIAMASHRNPSAMESERMLDQERWRVLDELSAGHYFDMDFLIVYAHKLLILERWEAVRVIDKTEALQDMLRRN